jgi:hypothetical protein
MRGPFLFAASDDESTPVHVAVVLATDGVRAIVAATTRDRLFAGLADYVARAAADRLWPADARRTQTLLAVGAHEAAVAHYFASVGARWDEEWLELRVLELLDPRAGAVAVNAGQLS